MIALPDRIKNHRLQRRLTKMQAAKQIGIRPSTLLNLERGDNPPSIRTFRLLARWLGMYDEEIMLYIRDKHDLPPIKEPERAQPRC